MQVLPVLGLPEFAPGMRIADLIVEAVGARGLADGDVLVVTSKIVSKVEGRFRAAAEKTVALEEETVRVVARIPGGRGSAIVENRLGLVMAAAGIDESNVEGDRLLLLPEHPDRSAREISARVEALTGLVVGVVISDTAGRPWRLGQTDLAIGAFRVQMFDDVRGGVDAVGKPLAVTLRCIGDELASAADLVKGKTAGVPVAIVRGLGHHVGDRFVEGARAVVRPSDADLFRLGTAEAIAEGRRIERSAGGATS